MKIFIGSVIVIVLSAITTWFLLSFLFKPVGSIINKQTNSFIKKMNESSQGRDKSE